MSSTLPDWFDLILVDSTGRSVPPPPLAKRILYSIPRVLRFFSAVRRLKPDAVFVFASTGMSFVEKATFARYCDALGIASFIFLVGGGLIGRCETRPLYARFCSAMLSGNSTIVCQGARWVDFVTQTLSLPRTRCLILRNWTATPHLLKIGADRKYERTVVTVLFMGWVDKTKGVLDLIDAVTLLHGRVGLAPFRLVIAGQGNASQQVQELIEERGLGEVVQLVGWVEGSRKLGAIESADLFVLPSYFEGMPNAMIEAMAAGLPVVVTPVGNIADAVAHEVEGLISPPGDIQSLTEALARLIQDGSLRRRLGAAAYAKAASRYALEGVVQTLRQRMQPAKL
jgi:glycosyltransferase involved in cell wall biosynthesis